MELLFHAQTQRSIKEFLARPAHALLLVGTQGTGKGTTAQYIAAEVLAVPIEKVSDHPYVHWLHDLSKGISIDDIRGAQSFMQLRVPGKHRIRRVLIVEQGETMSQEAQNAFLKLLEEPPADTIIIITAANIENILPTIRSRVQTLFLLPPTEQQLQKFYGASHSPATITKSFYMSEGAMGLMHALLTDDNDHPLVLQITQAKQLLSSTLYDRLCQVDTLVKQKDISLLLLAMERVSHAALTQALHKHNPTAQRWAKRLRAIVDAQQRVRTATQAKLVLTNLMLEM